VSAAAAAGAAGAGGVPGSSSDAATFLDRVKTFYHNEPHTAQHLVYMLQEFQNRRMGPETLVRNILSLIKRAPDSMVVSLLSFVPAKLGHLIRAELQRRRDAARVHHVAH
jgi:histone deacetylase complex regulatory component SIN3